MSARRRRFAHSAGHRAGVITAVCARPVQLLNGRPPMRAFTRAAGVRADVVVEARGWPLTLRLVELGVGAAVVNDVVRVPRSLAAIRLRGLPPQIYWALRRASAAPTADAASLWSLLTTARGG